MPSNTSTAQALLKDVYEDGVKNQLMNDVPELELFEKLDDLNFEGRQVVMDVKVNRNRGSVALPEGGLVPTSGRQQHENFKVPLKYQYGKASLTEQVIRFSRSNKGSFARTLRDEMDGLVQDMRVQRSFYLWGWGLGIRALINGAASSTTQTFDAPGGVAGATNGTKFLNEGDYIGFVNPTTGLLRLTTNHQITSVPAAGTTAVITATASTTDNDYVVKIARTTGTLVIADTEYGMTPMGILGMIDDATYLDGYFGLSRTTFPILSSTVLTGVGALSADILQRAFDVVMERGSGQPQYLLCRPDTFRAYLTITEKDRRYTGGDLLNPDAGTSVVKKSWDTGAAFGGVPFKRCPDAPYGVIVGCDNRSGYRCAADDGSWVDRDGTIFERSTSAVDTWDLTYRIWDNYILTQPNQSFRLEGISANNVVVHRT